MNNAIARRMLLERIYDKMSDDEKRLFVMLSMQDRSSDEIMKALQQQSAQLRDLGRRQQTFGQDFLSNILGNATFDGAVWLLGRLFRK